MRRQDGADEKATKRGWGSCSSKFVRNFLQKEQTHYGVSAPTVKWDVDASHSSEDGLGLLPSMNTDICLECDETKLIIDCKFYREAFQSRFDSKMLISGHLYQLFSYLLGT